MEYNLYKFKNIKDCPLIKRNGLPSKDSVDNSCHGFDESWGLITICEICEDCPHFIMNKVKATI